MNNTRNHFFKPNDNNAKDDKNSTSTGHKNKFKTDTKLGLTNNSNWPKIKDFSNENKLDFGKTNFKFNTRAIFTGDPVINLSKYLF